jgi:hypothetical protein
MDSCSKTLISQPPDITVVVGHGDNAQEFQCYSVILASASPVLDAMLSSGMKESEEKRIEFPDKDPDEWRMLLRCIDNSTACLFRIVDQYQEEGDLEKMVIDRNVYALVPWFNELQMNSYLNRCDEILYEWMDTTISKGIEKDIEQFLFAIKYNLVRTQETCRSRICNHLEQFCWGFGEPDDFNPSTIQRLIGCFPLKKLDKMNNPHCGFEPCQHFDIWNQMIDLSVISLEVMNNDLMFSNLVHYALHSQHKFTKLELEEITSSLHGKTGPCLIKRSRSWVKQVEGNAEGGLLEKSDVQNAVRDFVRFDSLQTYYPHSRRYVVNKNKNTISLVYKKQETITGVVSAKQPSKADEKAIRSGETDLTVVVGSGSEKREFQCHAAVLAFASSKLDTLISTSDGKLFLPHLNPNAWIGFYDCISPSSNGECFETDVAVITAAPFYKQVDLLAPLFREFEMDAYLECCRNILQDRLTYLTQVEPDKKEITCLIEILQLSVKYNFSDLKVTAEEELKELYEDSVRLFDNDEVMEFDTIQSLVSVCLPIHRVSAQDLFFSTSPCSRIWQGLRTNIETHLKSLTFDKVDSSDCEWFAHLVHGFFRIEKLERRTNNGQ